MEIREGWFVVIALVFFLVGIFLGIGLSHDDYENDCKAGIITFEHQAYRCTAMGKDGGK